MSANKASLAFALSSFLLLPLAAHAGIASVEYAKKQAETQIRHLIEPVINKFCVEECKVLSVTPQIDVAAPDGLSPGFDEQDRRPGSELAPASASVKLLMDETVGPVSRQKLLDLLQQYLDTLDYPVKVDLALAKFPAPVGSAGRAAELREKVARQFRATIDDLFKQFCPKQCLFADFRLKTELVNAEEAQYGGADEFVQEGGIALRVKEVGGTILMDELLTPEERANIVEMAKLKTSYLSGVELEGKSLKFPRPSSDLAENGMIGGGRRIAGDRSANQDRTDAKSNSTQNSSSDSRAKQDSVSNSTTNANEQNQRSERFERFEKIERVESGDAVQAELSKFKSYGLIFACSVLALLIFLCMAAFRPSNGRGQAAVPGPSVLQRLVGDPTAESGAAVTAASEGATAEAPGGGSRALVAARYEIERLTEELMAVYATHPKVAKQVFTRVLTEEGIETTAQYMSLFGESIVMDMLRDPSLQRDLSELMEYYAKNPQELDDGEKLELLKRLHNRTVVGKLVVMGSRSSANFDFLAEMDGIQILELIKNESLTVKSIVLTQCDPQKRAAIYAQLDDDTRMKLLAELSRIDYLPKDYIHNVSAALKRKCKENPRLNTECLPGSDVLISLLERTGIEMQRNVMRQLDMANPDSARAVKAKLASVDTLRYLREQQLLEVILGLKHEELITFLKGCAGEIRDVIFSKTPRELSADLAEELAVTPAVNREAYSVVERKIFSRIKVMANEGIINLVETNERMFEGGDTRVAMQRPVSAAEDLARKAAA